MFCKWINRANCNALLHCHLLESYEFGFFLSFCMDIVYFNQECIEQEWGTLGPSGGVRLSSYQLQICGQWSGMMEVGVQQLL